MDAPSLTFGEVVGETVRLLAAANGPVERADAERRVERLLGLVGLGLAVEDDVAGARTAAIAVPEDHPDVTLLFALGPLGQGAWVDSLEEAPGAERTEVLIAGVRRACVLLPLALFADLFGIDAARH